MHALDGSDERGVPCAGTSFIESVFEGAFIDTWLFRMVSAKCTRRVAAWAATVVCVIVFGFAQLRYITNFLSGPYTAGGAAEQAAWVARAIALPASSCSVSS